MTQRKEVAKDLAEALDTIHEKHFPFEDDFTPEALDAINSIRKALDPTGNLRVAVERLSEKI